MHRNQEESGAGAGRPASTEARRSPRGAAPALAAALLALAGCKAPPPPETTSERSTMSVLPDARAVTLGPGDAVAFALHGVPEVSSPPEGVRVTLEGQLMVPVLGPVEIDGLTEAEAHALLTERLARYYRDPVVTLSVVERGARRFYLLGEFVRPGPQVMDRPLTALEAVTYGEGLKDGALRERVCLVRRHEDGLEVHTFSHAVPDAAALVQVVPGDVLYVAQSGAGRFDDRVVPYLQGLGFTTSQIASLIIVADSLSDE